MKKSRILWVGLLVLGWPMMGWGQTTCDDLAKDGIPKRLETIIGKWQKAGAKNKETLELFVSLKDFAQPGLTKSELTKALSLLTELGKKNLGPESQKLQEDMKAICRHCIESINMAEPSGEIKPQAADSEAVGLPAEPRFQKREKEKSAEKEKLVNPSTDSGFSFADWLMGIMATLLVGLLFWANRHRITEMLGEAETSWPTKNTGPNPYGQKTTEADFSANRPTGNFQNQENEQVNGLIKQLLAVQNRLADAELRISTLSVQNPNRAFIEQTVESYLQEKARKTDFLLVKPSPASTGREMPKEPNGFTNIDSQPGVFYMASPSLDGSFSVSNQNPGYRAGVSIYKFDVMADNPDRAEFILIDSPETLRRILNLIETYVEPVCTSINGYVSDARRIFTTNPGLAERQNDRWVVREKAEIKYV